MKTQNKLMKGLTAVCLSFLFFSAIKAQDLLTLKTGEEINVKVTEITDSEIKFKRTDNLEGPIRVYKKTEVFSVKYENGTKTVFNNVPQQSSAPVVFQLQAPIDTRFDNDSSDFAKTRQKRFGGPRVGTTFIGPGTVVDYLTYKGKNPVITQFGWQFETRLFTTESGLQGLLEFVPLVGGIEQGMFIPSINLLLGIRTGGKNTFEFAIGPNFTISADYMRRRKGAVGVVIACGTSFKSGNVNFPVTLAFVPSVGSKAEYDYYAPETNYDPFTNPNVQPTVKKGTQLQSGFKLSLLVGLNYRKK
jgi:hypothetical protein